MPVDRRHYRGGWRRFGFAANVDGFCPHGLVVLPVVVNNVHRELTIALVAKYRVPAVYPFRHFAAGGGLLSYFVK
jgi:hypothetical protein